MSGVASSQLLWVMNAFIAQSDDGDAWGDTLATICTLVGSECSLSRVALFEVQEDQASGLGVLCRADWARPGLEPIGRMWHRPVAHDSADDSQREWAGRRTRGEVIEGLTRDLTGYLRSVFDQLQIVRFYTVPVMTAGHWWGHFCIAHDDPDQPWDETSKALCHLVASLVGRSAERAQAERDINEITLRSMVGSALDAVVTIDEAGLILEFNPAAERTFGYQRADVIGRVLSETIIPSRYAIAHQEGLKRYLAGGEPSVLGRRVELEGKRADGSVFPVELTITEIRAGKRRFFTAYLRDISSFVNTQEALERLAYLDAMTGLPNRAGLLREVSTAPTAPTGVVVVHFRDLDVLAASLGREFTEPLVSQLALRLRLALRGDATLARIGEREFAIVLFRGNDALAAGRSVDVLFQAPLESDGRRFYLRARVGIARGLAPLEHMLRDAEMALHAQGRGHTVVFDQSLRADHQERLALETDLRDAILRRSQDLYLMFQPIVCCRTRQVMGFEALARWNHPRLGNVVPAEFVPVAEASGLSEHLGELVLERAVAACARWNHERAVKGLGPRYISINLSAPQVMAPDLASRIDTVLRQVKLSGEQVLFELTESTLLSEPEKAVEVMVQLQSLGCKVAIDDFGTGYSSFSYLQRLPVNVLKIDRSFIREIVENSRSRRIVGVMVDLAHAFGIEVVAEGVETADSLAEVVALGSDCVQGYLVGRPMSEDEARTWPDGDWVA
ncbi:EAL domain-containing protein [Xanthobacter sp. DSM 24535]|uniref:putative bifunctional diguanylate cyclase/phosphodiesterase n=1 Tax=Roseixanthobacter psychrophilus TaxID=3119917 RepID=UPI00372C0735